MVLKGFSFLQIGVPPLIASLFFIRLKVSFADFIWLTQKISNSSKQQGVKSFRRIGRYLRVELQY